MRQPPIGSFVLAFFGLSRPTFLAGGAIGVGLGTAIAAYASGGLVDWGAWLAAQLMVTALQLMTHYSNEYYDRDADVHATRTRFSGGSGVLVAGLVRPNVALIAALVALACGLAAIGWLASLGHAAATALGLTIAVLAWTYSSPPLRWLARGLGEADTASIVGFLVPLSAAAAQGSSPFSFAALAAVIPTTMATFVMMLAVEVPDAEADAIARKRNLVVRLQRLPNTGLTGVAALASIAIALVYVALAAAVAAGAPRAIVWFELLTIPAALGLAHLFWDVAGAAAVAARSGVAARGVAFFFLVTFMESLGFLVALSATF